MENGDKMGFIEMIRKTTILQRIMIVASTIWLLSMIDLNWKCKSGRKRDSATVCRLDIGNLASEGLIPIVLGWGSYWIIIEIMRKRKIKNRE